MAELAQELLAGTRVEIRTTVLPAFSVDAGDDGKGPGLLMRLLRPEVTVYRGSMRLVRLAPAGDPLESPASAIVPAVLFGLLALLVVSLLFGRS